MARLILAFIIAFLFSTAFGRFYIPWLRRQKAGQEIKSQVTWHQQKGGTPTMGGVMFILAVGLVLLTVGFADFLAGNFVAFFVYLFALCFGAIGFLDDWKKVKGHHNDGLSAKQKFLLQLAAALVFVFLMSKTGFVKEDHLYIPFVNKTVPFSKWVYYPFAAFVIVGTVNAVNITDGVDGLSTGTTLPVMLFYMVMGYRWGQQYLQLSVFASAMIGGLLGYLIYNFYPAKVFMGDTGSLFMGGAVAALAFAFDMPLILITLGFVYLCETLSDIIQVTYFKLTHGKRVFKMAPFHHHLEMGGWTGKKWKERELFFLFTGVSLLFAVISYTGVMNRF